MVDEVSVKFTGSLEGIETSVTQIREFLQGLESPIRGVREQLGQLAEAFVAAFAVEKIKQFAEAMGELGDKTEAAAAILGTSTEDIGRISLVAAQSGTSVEGLRSAMDRFALNVIERSDQTKRALAALGLSFSDLADKSAMGKLEELADAFRRVQDGPEKAAIAMALLGRSGAELIPLLNRGADGIREVGDQADSLGVTLDKATTEALAGTHRQFVLLSSAIQGAGIQAFLAFRTAIEGAVTIVRDLATSFTDAMRSGGMVRDLVTALGAAFRTLVSALAIGIAAFKAVWAAATDTIDVVGLGFLHLGDMIREIFAGLAGGISGFFAGLLTAARESLIATGALFADLGGVIKGAFSGNFADAWEKLKLDAAGASASIGASLRSSVSGFDFSAVRGEWGGFLADLRTRTQDYSASIKQTTQTLMNELATIWGTGDKHIEEEHDRHKARMASPTDTDAVSAAMKEIEGQIKAEQQGLQLKIAVWDAAVKQHKMTEQERFANVEQATQAEYEAELALLQKETQIDGLKLAQKQAINNKIRELEAKHTLDMVKLDTDAIAASQKQIEGYLGNITTAFNSQLHGLLSRTTSFSQAFKSIIGDLVISFIQGVEKMAVQFIAAQAAQTFAAVTGAQARASAETAGQATSIASTIANALRSIGASLGMTFAGVSANQAPLIGPAAPAEAAAVTAAVDAAAMGFLAGGANVASYDVGAWSVPRTGLALVHEREFIPPAGASDFARQAFTNALQGGGGSSARDVHLHLTAMDTQSGLAFIDKNLRQIAERLCGLMADEPRYRPSF